MRPPRIAAWLLERLLPRDAAQAAVGDLGEEYCRAARRRGVHARALVVLAPGDFARVGLQEARPAPTRDRRHAAGHQVRVALARAKPGLHRHGDRRARARHRRDERHLQLRGRRAAEASPLPRARPDRRGLGKNAGGVQELHLGAEFPGLARSEPRLREHRRLLQRPGHDDGSGRTGAGQCVARLTVVPRCLRRHSRARPDLYARRRVTVR